MKLIPANLDPEIQIKDTDVESYHVEFTRFEPTPDGRGRPNEVKDIQIFFPKVWKAIDKAIDKSGISFLNYDEIRIVHDPEQAENLAAVKAEKAKELADKKAAEAKEKEDVAAAIEAEKKEKEDAEAAVKAEEERLIKEAEDKEAALEKMRLEKAEATLKEKEAQERATAKAKGKPGPKPSPKT